MLNFPAQRRQSDGRQDEFSDAGALDTSHMKSLARQEFKDETDVNVLLRKYGVHVPQRQTHFGAIDTDVDLQQAIDAVHQAKSAWDQLPENLKERYGTWQALFNAVESGQLRIDNTPTPEEKHTERLARKQLELEEQRARDRELLAQARARQEDTT